MLKKWFIVPSLEKKQFILLKFSKSLTYVEPIKQNVLLKDF
jgi:hypothetical protein